MQALRTACHALALACAALTGCAAAAAAPGDYHLVKAVTLPGGDTGWDYNALDPSSGRLFIAHRKAGLHVYDTRSGRFLKTLAQSENTNTSALAPEFDLGIAGTTDGEVVVFRLSSLQTLRRYKSSTEGFDGATFDAVSERFAAVGEADEEHQRTPVLFFEGRTGAALGSLLIDSAKVDAPRADGRGGAFMPLRDRNALVQIDLRRMAVLRQLPLTGCIRPAALEIDRETQRLFVGCRGGDGSAPMLAVLDAGSGAQLALVPIGRGVDEVMFDRSSGQIISANGDDGSLTVIGRNAAGSYEVQATVGTRPRARTGVLDEKSGRIFLVTAEYVDHYVDGKPVEPSYRPHSFTVLTYAK
jgi:hypothetical protein